jgi:hypothetical protein
VPRGGRVDKNFERRSPKLPDRSNKPRERKGRGRRARRFQQIASTANLDRPRAQARGARIGAFSRRFAPQRRPARSEQGKKISEDLSNTSRDPFMHRKILGILQRLNKQKAKFVRKPRLLVFQTRISLFIFINSRKLSGKNIKFVKQNQ